MAVDPVTLGEIREMIVSAAIARAETLAPCDSPAAQVAILAQAMGLLEAARMIAEYPDDSKITLDVPASTATINGVDVPVTPLVVDPLPEGIVPARSGLIIVDDPVKPRMEMISVNGAADTAPILRTWVAEQGDRVDVFDRSQHDAECEGMWVEEAKAWTTCLCAARKAMAAVRVTVTDLDGITTIVPGHVDSTDPERPPAGQQTADPRIEGTPSPNPPKRRGRPPGPAVKKQAQRAKVTGRLVEKKPPTPAKPAKQAEPRKPAVSTIDDDEEIVSAMPRTVVGVKKATPHQGPEEWGCACGEWFTAKADWREHHERVRHNPGERHYLKHQPKGTASLVPTGLRTKPVVPNQTEKDFDK